MWSGMSAGTGIDEGKAKVKQWQHQPEHLITTDNVFRTMIDQKLERDDFAITVCGCSALQVVLNDLTTI